MSSVARPVFNHSHNGRMRNQPRANSSDGITYMSPSHQEAVQFLRESWNKILRDYRSGSAEAGGPEVYRQREQHPAIATFKKFDLEEYCGKKTMRRMTESS